VLAGGGLTSAIDTGRVPTSSEKIFEPVAEDASATWIEKLLIAGTVGVPASRPAGLSVNPAGSWLVADHV
jgi:hypothetical protein